MDSLFPRSICRSQTTILGSGRCVRLTGSNVKPDHFCCVESTSHAINEINRRLCEVPDIDFGSVWSEIDSAIQLRNCLVYSYLSDLSDDPLSEGQMYEWREGLRTSWSFNYFFYNKELKKVLFFACTARR